MTRQRPHVMILDEPTNHLDYKSIDALIVGIRSFEGSVIVTSHDQYFIQSIYKDLYVVERSGKIVAYRGCFEDYVSEITPLL